ncbi:ATP synthase F1 subunit delta [Flavonifractor sp. An92]|uniref:ATP synthase F1 subunit delta n=1 Tax=Flavonifractor sp. An92 TaxID=1965666 RepID=UPI000B3896C9|nr:MULTISPECIES: ATP synthase F1 subunit delta [unclassified Flavonifractor]OUN07869.1 ATP synthase F1 subunit delta [Flavonifractor sp. An92]OUQ22579.1 ATP synthase F1 subunit delta [Flavonifractor sp. An135]
MNELSRRYARALYAVSPDGEGLRATAGALMEDAALWEALRSPAIQSWEKARVLERLPQLDGHTLLRQFYRLLAEKGRMALLPDILKAYEDLELAGRGAVRCRMTCARVPGEAEQEKLKKALCRLHHKADVVFDIQVDPALLGGFILELEGVTYDKSVRGALSGLSRQLEERRMA